MGNAVPAELPGGQRGPLVARPRFIDPHMQRHPLVVAQVDGRGCRAPVHGGEPAGVAVGEHVDGCAASLVSGDLFQDGKTVATDGPVGLHILIANCPSQPISARPALAFGKRFQHRQDAVERPAKIDRGRPRAVQGLDRLGQHGVGSIAPQRQTNAIGGGRADERGAPDLHVPDGADGIAQGLEHHGFEDVRELRLVDDLDRAVIPGPDGAIGPAVDLHARWFSAIQLRFRSIKCVR